MGLGYLTGRGRGIKNSVRTTLILKYLGHMQVETPSRQLAKCGALGWMEFGSQPCKDGEFTELDEIV